MRILVTGGNGFIGREIINFLKHDHELIYPSSKELDLTNQIEVNQFFSSNNFFDWVIHCAVKGGRRVNSDGVEVFTSNMLMFTNILRNNSQFQYLINFSSGAEYDRSKCFMKDKISVKSSFPPDYYGLSKNLISRIIKDNSSIVNIRLYGVFGVNEDDHRFIKTTYKQITSNETVKIFNDIYFDFFFIQDLLSVVGYYIENFDTQIPNDLDLVYEEKYRLSDISEFVALEIGNKHDTNIESTIGNSYVGNYSNFLAQINLIGLKDGIKTTIDLLKKGDF